jgi:hypothetical protein
LPTFGPARYASVVDVSVAVDVWEKVVVIVEVSDRVTVASVVVVVAELLVGVVTVV